MPIPNTRDDREFQKFVEDASGNVAIRILGSGGEITFDGTVAVGDIVKRSGASTLGKVTQISELLIVSAHELATFTHNAGTTEKGGTVNNFTLSWTYNRNSDNPTSQSIDNGIGARPVADRSYAVVAAGLTTNTTYTISAVGDDTNPSNLSTTVSFQNKRYSGVSTSVITTGADIVTAFNATASFATSKLVTLNFDASVGGGNNYLYISYPTAFGAPSSTRFNGFAFTDYTQSTVSLTNASGWTENYYILRTNNTYSGASISWQIL